jgi:hypothetical protein
VEEAPVDILENTDSSDIAVYENDIQEDFTEQDDFPENDLESDLSEPVLQGTGAGGVNGNADEIENDTTQSVPDQVFIPDILTKEEENLQQTEFISQKEFTEPEKSAQQYAQHTFGEWLTILSTAASSVKSEYEKEKIEAGNNADASGSVSSKLSIKIRSKTEAQQIIDKFILEEPRIKRPQPAKFFKPEDVAELSVREDFTLATETLANIYIKQELYDKAMEIFTHLSLRYPQKSSYFAGRIEELKKKKEC